VSLQLLGHSLSDLRSKVKDKDSVELIMYLCHRYSSMDDEQENQIPLVLRLSPFPTDAVSQNILLYFVCTITLSLSSYNINGVSSR
jgi:hypothetical protein